MMLKDEVIHFVKDITWKYVLGLRIGPCPVCQEWISRGAPVVEVLTRSQRIRWRSYCYHEDCFAEALNQS